MQNLRKNSRFTLKKDISYKTVAKKLGIYYSIVSHWVKHFAAEDIKGIEEKRGKAKGPGLGRLRVKPEDPGTQNKRLEAENEMLETGDTITILCDFR